MLSHRVIPTLLLGKGGLVKTVKFANPKYIGDPLNAIKVFNTKEVDELIIVDIEASAAMREPNYELIGHLASECFMPVCYGGGIRTIEQASKIFKLGIEKISVQTAALENPLFIRQLANKFGSSSIVVSVDLKKDFFGRYKIFSPKSKKMTSQGILDYAKLITENGAGEILLNVVDKDGTLGGPDLDLIKKVAESVEIPVIALGGISSLNDIKECIRAGASAVAAGSYFVFHGKHRAVLITYPDYNELKKILNEE